MVRQLAQAAEPVFARHETFHPRYGWFRKAVAATKQSGRVFTGEDATVRLGVGKNMVRSIRFWGSAAKLIEPVADPNRPRLAQHRPTALGEAVFNDDGWDPWLEGSSSLWLLHWLMLRPPCLLPVWWVALNEFQAIEFSDDDLADFVADALRAVGNWGDIASSSIKKDVDCFVRTYSPREGRQGLDDGLDCPMRQLGLMASVPGERRTYRFLVGAKTTLPDPLVTFACLDFLADSPGTRTATLTRLAVDPGSPGRVFKLDEEALGDALNRHEQAGGPVSVGTVAGITQASWPEEPAPLAWRVLSGFFQQISGSDRAVVPASAGTSEADAPSAPEHSGSRDAEVLDEAIANTSDVLARLSLVQERLNLSKARSR